VLNKNAPVLHLSEAPEKPGLYCLEEAIYNMQFPAHSAFSAIHSFFSDGDFCQR